MYRRYTITGMSKPADVWDKGIGMKKKTQILLILFWGLAVAGSRILFFFTCRRSAVDTYEYFTNAMIQAEKSSVPFTSGLAYAYTEFLSDLLRFTGNRIEAVGICQMVIQILWIIILFAGIGMIFGKLAAAVSTTILASLPMILNSMFDPAAENFYMLHLSLVLVMLGAFCLQTKRNGWYERRLCELYLLVSGFYLGVVCIWNYVGFCLIPVCIYILILNHFALREKIRGQKEKEEQKLKDQVMGVFYQGFLLFAGMAAGMFATLMKYTGITGQTLIRQFDRWALQLQKFPERCLDISTWLFIAFSGAVLAGIFSKAVFWAVRNRKSGQIAENDEDQERTAESMEEENGEYVKTADGRVIKLLDNPLPVPKKHIKKEIKFDFEFDDLDENAGKEDGEKRKFDFDIEIEENDDFDYI